MMITAYSVLTAILWCNIFIGVVALIRRRDSFIIHFSIFPLLFLVFASIFRLLCSIELPITTVIRSEVILPTVIDSFTKPLVVMGSSASTVNIATILIVIWAGGCLYHIQKYIRSLIRFNKRIAAVPGTSDPQILSAVNEIVDESRKRRHVKIIKSTEIISPMVTGFFKPVILMPDIELSDSELKDILLHEWTHFLHKDAWVKLMMYVILTVFWWNPLIHLLNKDLDHILEIRCDLKLSAQWDKEKRFHYLENITKIVRWARHRKSLLDTPSHVTALISTKSSSKIEQRFNLVLNTESPKRYSLPSLLICGSMLLVLGFSYTFVLQPAGFPTAEPGYDFFVIKPENAYLISNEDGTYSLYVDDQYRINLTTIDSEPYLALPIK
ncbi:peptidase, M56 family [Desulfitobacterium hafniense DP7]|uniref:Peptidase, M56 family n=1 Tax=Desulfitobacterium hafniense DP7 TaxID=537010 RepID=G9XL38_DESHA|nr:M56 family metallopeptidase [Desulfitobacterium hafniense]EHL07555.1 peptidase, M56 family [Desulfitobacterium hafniense DP7]